VALWWIISLVLKLNKEPHGEGRELDAGKQRLDLSTGAIYKEKKRQ